MREKLKPGHRGGCGGAAGGLGGEALPGKAGGGGEGEGGGGIEGEGGGIAAANSTISPAAWKCWSAPALRIEPKPDTVIASSFGRLRETTSTSPTCTRQSIVRVSSLVCPAAA